MMCCDSAADKAASILNRTLALLGVCVFLSLGGCDWGDGGDDDPGRLPPLVPDSTVYIVSTLEFSPDTTLHHPQVYVGRLSTPSEPNYDLLNDAEHKPSDELWHPVLWAQVGLKLRELRLRPHADNHASVTVTGPLGRPEEREVPYVLERRGAYGDLARALVVMPGERYRLDVRLADGRSYGAETRVPAPAQLDMPDSLNIPVSLDPASSPGYPFEQGSHTFVSWMPASDGVITIFGLNHTLEHDYELWALGPGESLPYEDRSNYVRVGAQYYLFTNGVRTPQGFAAAWSWPVTRPPLAPQPVWIRVYQLNADLARFYHAEDIEVTVASDDPWSAQNWENATLWRRRDTTYFPSVSNVRRIGADGRPTAQNDAVGLFGAYSARYLRSVHVPVRSFDPDTLEYAPAQPATPPPGRRTRPHTR